MYILIITVKNAGLLQWCFQIDDYNKAYRAYHGACVLREVVGTFNVQLAWTATGEILEDTEVEA